MKHESTNADLCIIFYAFGNNAGLPEREHSATIDYSKSELPVCGRLINSKRGFVVPNSAGNRIHIIVPCSAVYYCRLKQLERLKKNGEPVASYRILMLVRARLRSWIVLIAMTL